MAAQRNWFAVVTSVIAVVLGTLLILGRSAAWYAIPIGLGIATYALARRLRKGTEAQITRHDYSLSAPKAAGRVAQLVERLVARGYQPEVRTLNDVGEAGPAAGSETALAGSQLKLVDKRADSDLGMITLRLRIEASGAVVGFLEADDTGPGFYDEMAQFLILELGSLVEGLEYVRIGDKDAGRRSATVLKDELPEKPYGLGLL